LPPKDLAAHARNLAWHPTPQAILSVATRITGGENPSGRTARKITESILSTLKILPAHE